MSKSKTEKIADIEQQIMQLQNNKKRLLQEQKEHDKKARTHRLIERGAMLESLIDGAELLTNEQISELLRKTVGSSYGIKTLDSIKSQDSADSAQRAEVTPAKDS